MCLSKTEQGLMKEIFLAYEAVRESGYYNMLDPRALALANEMNDMTITKAQWFDCMSNYEKYWVAWLKDQPQSPSNQVDFTEY